MMVETYFETEYSDIVTECEDLERWQKLADELGLPKQKNLSTNGKSPIPFPAMTEAMVHVYETLCPSKTKLSEYSRGTIPLRAMETLLLCKNENYFNCGIKIWYDAHSLDPIAVGYHTDESNDDGTPKEWRATAYIICRWGDELRSFAELSKIATERMIEKKTLALRKKINECEAQLNNISDQVKLYMLGEYVPFEA